MVLRIRNIKTETSSENESRYISINKYLKPVLKKLLKNNKGELLFPEFAQWKGSQAAKILFQACKETGIQYKRFHGIRHTVATHLLASGISLRDVMHVMGWKEIKTAQKYIHLVNASARHLNKLPY